MVTGWRAAARGFSNSPTPPHALIVILLGWACRSFGWAPGGGGFAWPDVAASSASPSWTGRPPMNWGKHPFSDLALTIAHPGAVELPKKTSETQTGLSNTL